MAPEGVGGDNLASAYVTILPDMDRFTEELAQGVQEAVDSQHPEVQVHADLDPFILELAKGIEEATDALHPKVKVEADLDTTELDAKAVAAAEVLDEVLGDKHTTPTADLNIAPLLTELTIAKGLLDDFGSKIYSPTILPKVLPAVGGGHVGDAESAVGGGTMGAISSAAAGQIASDALAHIDPNVVNAPGFRMFMSRLLGDIHDEIAKTAGDETAAIIGNLPNDVVVKITGHMQGLSNAVTRAKAVLSQVPDWVVTKFGGDISDLVAKVGEAKALSELASGLNPEQKINVTSDILNTIVPHDFHFPDVAQEAQAAQITGAKMMVMGGGEDQESPNIGPILGEINAAKEAAQAAASEWSNDSFDALAGVNDANVIAKFAADQALGEKWAAQEFWASANMTFLDTTSMHSELDDLAEEAKKAAAIAKKSMEEALVGQQQDFGSLFSPSHMGVLNHLKEAATPQEPDFGTLFSPEGIGEHVGQLKVPVEADTSKLTPEALAGKAMTQASLGDFEIPVKANFSLLPAAVQKALFDAAAHAKTTTGADAVSQVVSGKNQSAISLADLMAIAHSPTHTGAMTAAGIAGMLGGGGGGGPLITSQALQDAFYGTGGPNGFVQSLLSPLTMLTSLFGAHFMSLGSMAGFGPEHLAMTGVGALGSMAGGLGGGALLGTAALSTAAVGMGTDMAGFGQALGDIKSVNTAYTQLQTAVQQYGASSTQAQQAQLGLNTALTSFNPVAKQAVMSDVLLSHQFTSLFDKYTGQAENLAAQMIGQFIKVGEAFLPTIGHFATENMEIIKKNIQPFLSWMTSSSGGLGVFTTLEQVFTDHLPTAIHAFTQGFELFARTMQDLAPLTGKFIADLDRFFTKYNTWDFGKWIKGVDKLLSLWDSWKGFFTELFKDTVALFSLTAGLGQGLADQLTGYLDQLHNTLTNKGSGQSSLINLFKVHKAEILELVSVLIQLGSSFAKVYLVAAPALTALTVVVLQLTNALLGLVRHIPGGDFGLGLTLILAKWGVLADLLGVGTQKAGLLAAAFRGLGKITGIQFLIDQMKTLGSVMVGGGTAASKASNAAVLGGMTANHAEQAKADAAAVAAGTMSVADADAAAAGRAEQLAATQKELESSNTSLIGSFWAMTTAMGASAAAMLGIETESTVLTGVLGILSEVGILAVAVGVYELIHHFGVLHGLLISGAAAVGILTLAFIALDSVPIVAALAGLGLIIAGMVAGVIELWTHFGTLGKVLAVVAGVVTLAAAAFGIWAIAVMGATTATDLLAAAALAVDAIPIVALVVAIAAAVAALAFGIYELVTHWREVWNFVKHITEEAVSFIKGHIYILAGTILAPLIPLYELYKHWGTVWDGMKIALRDFVGFFEALPGEIGHAMSRIPHLVMDALKLALKAFVIFPLEAAAFMLGAGVKIMALLVEGLIHGAPAVLHFMASLPKKIFDLWVGANVLLLHVGEDILKGLAKGIEVGAVAVWHFLQAAPGKIFSFFAGAVSWLVGAGLDILKGLYNGIFSGHGTIDHFFAALPGEILGFFSAAGSWLLHVGSMIISGFVAGIKEDWHLAEDFFKSVPHLIESAFSDAGTWLIDAGKDVIKGLWNGIKGAAGDVKGIAGDVAHSVIGAFKSGFGIFSPSKATTDIGNNVSQGLANGITQGGSQAIAAAAKLSKDVSAQFGSMKAPAADAKAIKGLSDFFHNLSGVFSNLNSSVSGASKIKAGDIQKITDALNFLSNQGVGSISKAIDHLEGAFGTIKKKSGETLQKITDTFGVISKLFNAIQTSVRTSKGVANIQEIVVGLDTVLFWSRRYLVTAITEIEGAFGPLEGKTHHAVQKITDTFGALSKLFNAVQTTIRTSGGVAKMAEITTALNTMLFWGEFSIVPKIINIEVTFDALGKKVNQTLQHITNFFGALSKMFNAVGTTSRASFNTMGLANVGHALVGLEIWGAMKVGPALKIIDDVYSKAKAEADGAVKHATDLFGSLSKLFNAVGTAVNAATKTLGLNQVITGSPC